MLHRISGFGASADLREAKFQAIETKKHRMARCLSVGWLKRQMSVSTVSPFVSVKVAFRSAVIVTDSTSSRQRESEYSGLG